MRKLLEKYRRDINVMAVLGQRGNSYIRKKINVFNNAPTYTPHFILTDLDNQACAPELIQAWLAQAPTKNCLFRIAEREVEAWLLADTKNFARFIGFPENRIRKPTDLISDPKRFIINAARQSKNRAVKDMIPLGVAHQGPGYNTIMHEFINKRWNPKMAAKNNRSLAKTITRLKEFLR